MGGAGDWIEILVRLMGNRMRMEVEGWMVDKDWIGIVKFACNGFYVLKVGV